jgi:hypothetical protein
VLLVEKSEIRRRSGNAELARDAQRGITGREIAFRQIPQRMPVPASMCSGLETRS